MPYSKNSNWNDLYEMECLFIFKKLEEENFPRGKQMELCRELSKTCSLSKETLSAKVSNYKSVAGVNKSSNASQNTEGIYEKHKGRTIPELEAEISSLQKSGQANEGS